MRIAYICGYQGDDLLSQRAIVRGRSLAGTQKAKLVAQALHAAGNEVIVFPEGIPTENAYRFYKGFKSEIAGLSGQSAIEVHYPFGIDMPVLRSIIGKVHMLWLLLVNHCKHRFDVLIVYDLSVFQSLQAVFGMVLGLPVVIDYEDDALVGLSGKKNWLNYLHFIVYRLIRNKIRGIFAVSPELLEQFPATIPHGVIRGIIGDDLQDAIENKKVPKQNRVLYCGGLVPGKGIDKLIEAWKLCECNNWEFHICGSGTAEPALRQLAHDSKSIRFHGLVDRTLLIELLCSARICVNPHPLTSKPGNIFPFKIVEYLAAGALVVSTPMCKFDDGMEPGIVFTRDDSAKALSDGLQYAIQKPDSSASAQAFVTKMYSFSCVSLQLNELIHTAIEHR